MPYKDPSKHKEHQRKQYQLKKDLYWKNPDGTWKTQPLEKRREYARKSYLKHKDTIRKQIKEKRSNIVRSRGTLCPLCCKHYDKLVYEHNHTDGMFRGYVCSNCNGAMGLAGEDYQTLERMIHQYLKGELICPIMVPGDIVKEKTPKKLVGGNKTH